MSRPTRDSGVRWIGAIPEGWDVEPFRRLFRESKEVNGATPVGPMLSISGYRGVEQKVYESESLVRDDDQLETYRVVRPGQLAVNTMWLNYAGLGVSALLGHVSPAYRAYWVSGRLDGRFAHHLLRSSIYVQGYTALLTGIRPNSLQMSRADLTAFPVLVPPLDEQRVIADYLDRETAQIDAFIAKNEELIALLTERRASVLTAAMSEGSTRMRLRQVLTVAQTGPFGTQLAASEYVDGGVPVINPSHIVEGAIAHDVAVSVPVERARELLRFRLSVDDIVLGRKGEVDKAALVDEASDGYLCGSDSMMLRPAKTTVHPKYLWWFLQSPPAHEQLERFAVGSTVVGLNQRTLRVVQLPVPSLEEQQAIVDDLDRSTTAIRSAVTVAKRSVELARERRAALISAAVTGKIDVGVAA